MADLHTYGDAGRRAVLVIHSWWGKSVGHHDSPSRSPAGAPPERVTSERIAEFVGGLGCYDTVLTYDALDDLDGGLDTVSIDMAGNPAVLAAVHHRLGDRLEYSMTVGRSHHDAPAPAAEPMPGPAPELFFAPTEVSRRRNEWGREDFERRAADALAGFVEGSRSWLTVEHRTGPEATAAAWRDVYNGVVAPDVGLVATLHA